MCRLRLGDGLDYLIGKAERGSKAAQNEIAKIVTPENLVFWQAFSELHNARIYGMAPEPIAISEIKAISDILGINCGNQRRRLLKAVRAMDAAWLKWTAENGNA